MEDKTKRWRAGWPGGVKETHLAESMHAGCGDGFIEHLQADSAVEVTKSRGDGGSDVQHAAVVLTEGNVRRWGDGVRRWWRR